VQLTKVFLRPSWAKFLHLVHRLLVLFACAWGVERRFGGVDISQRSKTSADFHGFLGGDRYDSELNREMLCLWLYKNSDEADEA
jgi:hypothetical protein